MFPLKASVKLGLGMAVLVGFGDPGMPGITGRGISDAALVVPSSRFKYVRRSTAVRRRVAEGSWVASQSTEARHFIDLT